MNSQENTMESQDYSNFWPIFLEFGDSEQQREFFWNIYCIHILKIHQDPMYRHIDWALIRKRIGIFDDVGMNHIDEVKQFVNDNGGPLSLPVDYSQYDLKFMDFRKVQTEIHISFKNRILVLANFSEMKFNHGACFDNCIFLREADFQNTKFESDSIGNLPYAVTFNKTEFFNEVEFSQSEIHNAVEFSETKFHGPALFNNVILNPNKKPPAYIHYVVFENCRFNNVTFFGSEFHTGVKFNNSVFSSDSNFGCVKFLGPINFNNTKFKSTTSFDSTIFEFPPTFFEAELHEDTSFNNTKWNPKRDKTTPDILFDASSAIRAWDRLELIMSQQEGLEDRHTFFKLKMRVQRITNKHWLPTFVNWLFDKSSDYGWGLRQATNSWFMHIGLGAFFIFLPSFANRPHDWVLMLRDSLLLSFSNSHSIFRFSAYDGPLFHAKQRIYNVTDMQGYLNAIYFLQGILGPIFLFLLLLTLRNRFRIG